MKNQETRFLIPIYLSNIILVKCKKTGVTEKILQEVFLKKVVIKGFTIKEIAEKEKQKIFKKGSLESALKKEEYFKIKLIELLSQHGKGILEN